MRVSIWHVVFFILLSGCAVSQNDMELSEEARASSNKELFSSRLKGWDYIAQKLIKDGVPEERVRAIYSDPRMPDFTPVPFQLKPKETAALYAGFTTDKLVRQGHDFLKLYEQAFQTAEKRYGVSRYIVASILLVETKCGKNTGNQVVLNRLSRVASVGEPKNLEYNLEEQRKVDATVTLDQVKARANYLEETFYPEVQALFKMQGGDLFDLKGSMAGAFGIPQFLPSTYLKYGIDGDGDGVVSLFSEVDAIFSAAHFLSMKGWREAGSSTQKKKVLWAYNRSDAYGEAILKIAIQMKQISTVKSKKKGYNKSSKV